MSQTAEVAPARGWREPGPLALTPILTAALDAFYDNGYHATSVRDIARRVQVTVPALYYHHENKEALLVELLNRSIDLVTDLCLERWRTRGTTRNCASATSWSASCCSWR